jgi:hypothetical protein
MSISPGPILFVRGKDRLFDYMDQFVVQQSMFTIGLLWASGSLGRGPAQDDVVSIDSFAFPLSLDVPFGGVAEDAFAERAARSRNFVIKSGKQAHEMPESSAFTQGFNRVLWLPITPIFVNFYEQVRPWMEMNFKKQTLWPSTMFFASFIRNAVSHGGLLHITHNSGRTGQWHHLAYRYGDKDQIIGPRGALSPSDFIFLMLEMSEELDQIGCPHL